MIEELLFLSRTDPDMLKSRVCTDFHPSWRGMPPDEFTSHAAALVNGVAGKVRELIQNRLLAECLIFGEHCNEAADRLLYGHPEILNGLPDSVKECYSAWVWRHAPVIMVRNGEGLLRHFIVGRPRDGECRGRLWPEWAGKLMDDECKTAISNAAEACRRLPDCPADASFFCFPLAVPNGVIQFEGASLGLPLALGFLSTTAGAPMPGNVLATGGLDENGGVTPVGGLPEKIACAESRGGALIHPAENAVPEKNPYLTLLPVKTLSQAWMFARLYHPDSADRLTLFSAMLADARTFISNIGQVPPDWLDWARRQGATQKVMAEIEQTPALFSGLTDQFQSVVRASDTRLSEGVSGLVDEAGLAMARKTAPLAAFRWCGINLSLNNHRGRIDAADAWVRTADDLISRAKKADVEAVADFFNTALVARHNRYLFFPELPAELNTLLAMLERQYEIQCEFGCPVHMVLGRLYGSITQNFGFCGPDCFDRVEDCCARARKALGEENAPEFEAEWRRQYNYLTFACLDAGKLDRAERALHAYLDVTGWADLWDGLPSLGQWAHFLLARYLADAGDAALAGKYLAALEAGGWPPERIRAHPWQLWRFNMGRIALALSDRAAAEDHFRKSLNLCVGNEFGPTVTVMALLPLSGLRRLDRLENADMSIAAQRVIPAAERLNGTYFKTVIAARDHVRTLDRVWERPSDLFPFSYR